MMIALSIGIAATGPALADDIKTRMIQRLPEINALKQKGIIGENNAGLLEFIGADRKGETVITAENRDRRTVYTRIARRENSTPETVGRHRAAQISRQAASGDRLQDASGKWYQKP